MLVTQGLAKELVSKPPDCCWDWLAMNSAMRCLSHPAMDSAVGTRTVTPKLLLERGVLMGSPRGWAMQ